MGYKRISHKSKEMKGIVKCTICSRHFIGEKGEDLDTCPRCAKQIIDKLILQEASNG